MAGLTSATMPTPPATPAPPSSATRPPPPRRSWTRAPCRPAVASTPAAACSRLWLYPCCALSPFAVCAGCSLVKEGLELDQAYVFKYCSPTRCSLQTGRNPVHVNVMNLDPVNVNPSDPVGGFSAAAPKFTGVAAVLKAAGYATGFAGKWDVGMAMMSQTPRGRGYDQSLHYFHHENECVPTAVACLRFCLCADTLPPCSYWTYEVGSCPSATNHSIKQGIFDLWEGKLGGGEGPAHPRVSASQGTCPYYQDVNRSDCE